MSRRFELLAPAGNLEKAKIALLYGADAVYGGGKKFSLRARASNFDLDEIRELCTFAHNLGKRVYITMNIIPRDGDFDGLDEYLKALEVAKVDAIIVSSSYIMERAKVVAPHVELHLSTQKSATNLATINHYYQKGITRAVLARELTLEEITKVAKAAPCELEVFIHGGMCASYSGHCLLSNHMTNRDANRGGCAHSCRWNYTLCENGCDLPKFFNFGSKDLMALRYIPTLIDLGIASFKIEGRMKSTYYLACVVRAYRKLIDLYLEKGEVSESDFEYLTREIEKAENRQTCSGFYDGIPNEEYQLYDNRNEIPTQEYVAFILDYDEAKGRALIEQRNHFSVGEELEVFGPQYDGKIIKATNMVDAETGEALEVARHPLQKMWIDMPFKVEPGDLIRKNK